MTDIILEYFNDNDSENVIDDTLTISYHFEDDYAVFDYILNSNKEDILGNLSDDILNDIEKKFYKVYEKTYGFYKTKRLF